MYCRRRIALPSADVAPPDVEGPASPPDVVGALGAAIEMTFLSRLSPKITFRRKDYNTNIIPYSPEIFFV